MVINMSICCGMKKQFIVKTIFFLIDHGEYAIFISDEPLGSLQRLLLTNTPPSGAGYLFI